MSEHQTITDHTPATLFELADTGHAGVADAVLADADARKDYETRARHGVPVELALAWGVAALAAGDPGAARRHWEDARRLAPGDRAIPRLLAALPNAGPASAPSPAQREAARAELARVSHNSAFPHRLVRFAAALAAEPDDTTPDAIRLARELVERDIREAPRSYAMILPVLRGHYPAVYALDLPFLDATTAVLADHGPRAEYERKVSRRKRAPKSAPPAEPPMEAATEVPDLPRVLPPLRIPHRRWVWPSLPRRTPGRATAAPRRLPSTGYAWVGAVLGALFFARHGVVAMLAAAAVGFLLAWGVHAMSRRP